MIMLRVVLLSAVMVCVCVIMLSFIMLSFIMLSLVILDIIMLKITLWAPCKLCRCFFFLFSTQFLLIYSKKSKISELIIFSHATFTLIVVEMATYFYTDLYIFRTYILACGGSTSGSTLASSFRGQGFISSHCSRCENTLFF